MKTFFKSLIFLFWMIPISLFAQTSVTGTITGKSDGLPILGVNIIVQGSNNGTTTDFDGKYTLSGVKSGDLILFSYVGFAAQKVNYVDQKQINISLEADSTLEEVIVIGYGSTNKKDATGSLTQINSKQMNKGAIVTADQLLTGKVAGLRIANSGGQPDADPNLRIRGGASLGANNRPLIVIDGVPISNDNPAGQKNPLTLVNPNDIASFTILKDASSTAIYGSRASNGVIIITTKKGTSGEAKFNFSSSTQVGKISNKLDLLSSSEYVDFINTNFPDQIDLLGVDGQIFDTDWQEEIYRTSISTDNNFSVRANLFDKLPIRASIGHSDAQGVLRESSLERFTGSLSLTPKFFDEHLKVTTNMRGVLTRKEQPDEEAIGSAISLNPTVPIFDPNGNNFFGGFYQTLDQNATTDTFTRTAGPTNAVAQLQQRDRDENSDRIIGNIEFDYSFHFLPELRAILNLGIDHSKSTITEFTDLNAIKAYNNFEDNPLFNAGETYREDQERTDKLLESYLSYTKSFDGFLSKIDAQGGYSYQDFSSFGSKLQFSNKDGVNTRIADFEYNNPLNLQSFFGRVNVDLQSKYLITASFRTDASSLFPADRRWGNFPAAAAAWKIGEENWFKNSGVVSSLKLRAGWGITGQQSIENTVAGFFPFTPLYLEGNETVQYQFGTDVQGNPIFVTTNLAQGFNQTLTWETTETLNAGLDFGLWNNRVSGNIDVYKRFTDDLLAEVPQPEGSLINRFVSNIGKTESEGFEVTLNTIPVSTDSFTWEVSGNVAYNKTILTDLNSVTQITQPDTGIGRGTGVNIGAYSVGQQAGTFWLYEQIYDTNGSAIPDAFVDQNNDGTINDEDRIFIPYNPNWTYGFGTSFTYKNFDFSANFRGQVGGKIFNANLLNGGFRNGVLPLSGNGFLNNILDRLDGATYNGLRANPSDEQSLSNLFVSDASFLRFDNMTAGYKLNGLFDDKVAIRFYASINNLFVLTNYEGLDPENFKGIEDEPYARPRVYTIGLNMNF